MQLQILEEQDDERYIKCEPIEEFRIFDVVVDKEEIYMFEIFIAKGQDLEKLQPVFNSIDDYGATISFGAEDIFGDHIIELNFEKDEIEDNGLVG